MISSEKEKKRNLERRRRPENIAKKKEYDKKYRQRPEILAREKKRHATELYRAYSKEYWKRKSKEPGFRAKEREDWLKKRYGITPQDVLVKIESQGGVCAICGTKNWGRWGTPYVDHDHKTDKIRGILCYSCNMGIGHLKDDANTVYSAACYLRDHNDT
jgi:hypothetical protein